MRNRHELGLLVANAFHHETGQAVAVMGKYENQAPVFMAFANGQALTLEDTKTPVVNLYQSAAEEGISSSNRDIYCSYVPTAACLGILRMSNARAIFYIDNNLMRRIALGNGRVPTLANAANAPVDNMAHALMSNHGLAGNWFAQGGAMRRQFARTWLDQVQPPANALWDSYKALVSIMNMRGPLAGVPHEPTFALHAAATQVHAVRALYRGAIFMALARVLASVTWTGAQTGSPHQIDLRTATGFHTMGAGKNIAALLVDGTSIIGWGVNTNDHNGTRHAETNAIQAYQRAQGTALPAGVTLYTTLQPCFMCAGLYSHAGGTHCLFDQSDPGMQAGTALANSEQSYLGDYSMEGTFGHALTTRNAQFVLRAPDFLRTRAAAQHYANALQRFVVMGMKAQSLGERNLWQECMTFLRQGPLAPIMGRPDLFLID